ncbi:aminopeptidase [Bacillus salitolerans]|uniref:Aminopeptidase n=1 Tax=Bacillus salitolerans TaxID=1437434 RepID=A0ABW4LQM1_9BACI
MNHFEANLEKYADVIIKLGINLQKGQTLLIEAPIFSAYFTRKIVKRAYEEGAKMVIVDYHDEELSKLHYCMQPMEGLKEFPMWKANGYAEMAETGDLAILQIYAPNPDLLSDVDPERISIRNKTNRTAMKKFNDYVSSGKMNWCTASIPSNEWAAKVLPDVHEDKRISKMWELIFQMTRSDTPDPVQAWQEHMNQLTTRANDLNERKYKKLHYKGPGTDLTIELPKEHKWMCASFQNEKQTTFIPNLPTEEVFTVPLKYGVNGTVSSTKPLNYNGVLVEDFTLTFKEGKVIDVKAATGEETLRKLIETDEGAAYLGEVALVSHQSPISKSNILFYNTLFDENASCHLALGFPLPVCIEGENKDKQRLKEIGLNDSVTHVDFMIGSGQLNIEGERESGEVEPIFLNGEWCK